MTTEALLAVLEEKPYTIKELAALLDVNHWTLRDRVASLAAQGVLTLQKDVTPFRVALGSTPFEADTSAPPKPKPQAPRSQAHKTPFNQFYPLGRNARPAREKIWPERKQLSQLRDNQAVDAQLGIEETHPGPAVCGSCGKRFTPLRATETFCSTRCEQIGPPPATVTRVIDGQVFEAVSVGSAAVTGDWSRKKDHGENGIEKGGRHGAKGAE